MGKTLGRSGSLIIGDGWKKVYGKVSGRANVDGTQALKKNWLTKKVVMHH